MSSKVHGQNTLEVEVTNISMHGIWLLFENNEYFLPYDFFPWFKEAPVSKILNVQKISKEHFYWPDLDIDLTLNIISNPEIYPLIAKKDYS